jgi:DnaK suppressor protein
MNKRQQETLRKRLEARRAEIETDMSYMAAEMRSIGVDQDEENGSLGNHIADDGSNVAEAERMNEGNYGVCQRCGQPIGAERLKAFPYVAYCIECQSLVERDQAIRAGA